MQNYDHYPKLFLKIWTSIVKIRTLCAKSQFYKHKKVGEFDFFIESTDLYPFFSSTHPHGKKQPSRPHGKKQSSMQQQCCCPKVRMTIIPNYNQLLFLNSLGVMPISSLNTREK